MTLSYHICKQIKKPHKPEINYKVKSLKEVKEISRRHPNVKMYVNWNLSNGYIIENGKIIYNRIKESTK